MSTHHGSSRATICTIMDGHSRKKLVSLYDDQVGIGCAIVALQTVELPTYSLSSGYSIIKCRLHTCLDEHEQPAALPQIE